MYKQWERETRGDDDLYWWASDDGDADDDNGKTTRRLLWTYESCIIFTIYRRGLAVRLMRAVSTLGVFLFLLFPSLFALYMFTDARGVICSYIVMLVDGWMVWLHWALCRDDVDLMYYIEHTARRLADAIYVQIKREIDSEPPCIWRPNKARNCCKCKWRDIAGCLCRWWGSIPHQTWLEMRCGWIGFGL